MRSIIALPIIAFILLSSFCLAIETVNEVKPQITAAFQEKVVLISYVIEEVETGRIIPVDLSSQIDDKTFVFVPSKALLNGRHDLVIHASDLVGNPNKYIYSFDVFIPSTTIELLEPNSIGVGNSTEFTVAVKTSRPCECKYTGVSVGSFDDIRLKYFDSTGDASAEDLQMIHKIFDYEVDPDNPLGFRILVVACKDDLERENFNNFRIFADTTPPKIESATFDPSPLVEFPLSGAIFSTLTVKASEPVICRYIEADNTTYWDMVAFTGYDQDDFYAYEKAASDDIVFPGVPLKASHTFYVECEDRARFHSPRVTVPLDIDLSAGLKISVLSPPKMSKGNNILLNVTTNRNSYCVYKSNNEGIGPTSYSDPSARLSSSYNDLDTVHYRGIGKRPAGAYSISIRCDVPEGVGFDPMSNTIDYTFVIDNTPPSVPVVNATSPVCSNKLSAEFSANDTHSGISGYRWVVGTAGTPMANGSTSDDSVSVSKSNNGTAFSLVSSRNYVFNIWAVDGAGNIGQQGVSNMITFDETGKSCDNIPPTIIVEKSSAGDTVSMSCIDNQSGCSPIGSYYGTSYDKGCNATQYFIDPVVIPLFKTTVVCWDVKDNADNVARGSQTVLLDLSDLGLNQTGGACPGGIDKDNDGYGERCVLGFDCDDTDPLQNIGCANGCIQDLDGDGYGPGCILGDDCNGRNADLTTVCPNNCISDGDGDEFGLGCTNGPDCKGDDSSLTVNCPNGCVDDNDGDSYGLECPVGFDCHGEDFRMLVGCDNSCIQDTDGDGFGVGCSLGLDCNGRHPRWTDNCTDGCVFDEDGDGYGLGCANNQDCDGMNPLHLVGCSNNCITDNDGDGYGWGCDNQADCNDTDPYVNLDCTQTTDCIYDHDGDGYGLGCELGSDCEDYDKLITSNCSFNCSYDEDCNGLP
ncbi:hypothetical protein ACFL3V_01770, partial [Nanoarchaeota archaeon]